LNGSKERTKTRTMKKHKSNVKMETIKNNSWTTNKSNKIGKDQET